MSIPLQRKLFIVRVAFATLVAFFVGATIWALSASPQATVADVDSDAPATLPLMAAAPAIPSEEAVYAALEDLGVQVDGFSGDGFGFGTAYGVPARIALDGDSAVLVTTEQMEGRALCDGEGPTGEDLLKAWGRLVAYDGETGHRFAEEPDNLVTAGPEIQGVNFWEFSGVAAQLRYGTAPCYFTATFPFTGSIGLSGQVDMGTVSEAASEAAKSVGRSIQVLDQRFGYLPHPSGGGHPAWYLKIEESGSSTGPAWFVVPVGVS